MPELRLVYRDENWTDRRVTVRGDSFSIGRHSANDLYIPDSRLSREHLRIEQFAGRFTAADLGSSNGTRLNGSELNGSRELSNGDILDLGGGVEITIEFGSEDATSSQTPPADPHSGSVAAASAEPPAAHAQTVSEMGGRSIPTFVFLILPVIALFVVGIFGVGVYLMRDTGSLAVQNSGNEDDLGGDEDLDPDSDKPVNEERTPEPVNRSPENGNASNNGNVQALPSPVSEFADAERFGSTFMRQIAQNDPRAFLTSSQAEIVGKKIKQISTSPAVAANIEAARKDSAKITRAAAAKNLRPQFLAAAAIARLGGQRGDVGQTAEQMAEVLGALNLQLGSERADDTTLLIAAYEQGLAGETMKLRNMLQKLSGEVSESSRTVRTIWFLQRAGKITEKEFDLAVRFLAVGTIMQNPKSFNVNTEALVF